MFRLVVLALASALSWKASLAGMPGVDMADDHRLFIAIACYAVAVVLLLPLLLSLMRYAITVATGLPLILRSKSLPIGFAVAALGLCVAAWSSHAGNSGLPTFGDSPQSTTAKSVPSKGGTFTSSREKKHD